MSIVRDFINSAPVRERLEFGINKNVRLVKVSNEEILIDGLRLNKNTHLTFKKYDDEGNEIAESTFNYWDLDSKKSFVRDNFMTQLGQLSALVYAVAGEDIGKSYNPVDDVADGEDLLNRLKTASGCQNLQERMVNEFIDAIGSAANENSPLLRLKVVTSPDGKYLNLPNSIQFVESMDIPEEKSILQITAKEREYYLNGFKPEQEKPDNLITKEPDVDI